MKPIHWRRSRIGKYLRHLPRPKHIRGTLAHRLFGERLFDSGLWHPSRHRFAAGMALGAFFALMPPLPVQMLCALVIAYITRVYVPAALLGTWISNPLTTPFIVYWQYRLGCVLLDRQPGNLKVDHLLETLGGAPAPYFAGVLPSATLLALVAYPLTLVTWDWVTERLEAARKRRRAATARKVLQNALPAATREKPPQHAESGFPR